jgi:hypothetical protein
MGLNLVATGLVADGHFRHSPKDIFVASICAE